MVHAQHANLGCLNDPRSGSHVCSACACFNLQSRLVKLARVDIICLWLQSSVEGGGGLALIGHVSPDRDDAKETEATLRFAQAADEMRMRPQVCKLPEPCIR